LRRTGYPTSFAAAFAAATSLRPHEDEPGVFHRLGEVRALGEKPIARMNRIRPGLPGRIQQAFNAEI
jgi:hypothetical protein